MTIVEAFAWGVPAVCSRLGSMTEIVEDGHTGLHFTACDAADLAAKVDWAWSHPAEMRAMGRNAREVFEIRYTAEKHYAMLMEVYAGVVRPAPTFVQVPEAAPVSAFQVSQVHPGALKAL